VIQFVAQLLEIVRPFGLKRLVFACLTLFIQALAQLAAVFSIVPFLTAAADIDALRASRVGQMFIGAIGGASDRELLIATGSASLILLLLGNCVSLWAEWSRAQYAFHVGHQIRTTLVSRLLRRRFEYFGTLNSAILLKNIVEDVTAFTMNVLNPSLDIFARVLLVVLLAGFLILIEPMVSLAAAGVLFAYFLLLVRPLRQLAVRYSDMMMHTLRAIYFQVSEMLSGVKPILANEAQEYFGQRIKSTSAKLSEILPRTALIQAVPRSLLEVLVFGGLVLWILISLTSGADLIAMMPRVGLIAMVAYRLMPSLQLISSSMVAIETKRQSMDEVLKLLREQGIHSSSSVPVDSAVDVAPLEWNHDFRFEGVGFQYNGAVSRALDDISFTIRKGERVAFVGPTGSGKSTLIDLILGLLEPSEGEIIVDGVPLVGERYRQWRTAIGYVPQELFLLDASIAENIAFGVEPDEINLEKLQTVARRAHATDFIAAHGSEGIWSVVGERGAKLSGGQRQRLALARALYRQPSVLVLDEATSALDPRTEAKIMHEVLTTDETLTIITVAHRLSTVKECDRIYFVQDGRITAEGSYDELVGGHSGFRQFAQ
jgi:ATP-binding cassette, subfamily B, bacterial PglK